MNIYNYDMNGVYLYTSQAMANPLEQGEYLVPAYATTVAPPSVGVDEVAVFDLISETWSIVENHIGKEGYLGDEPYTISDLGELPVGFTLTKPLAVLKKEKKTELSTFVDNMVRNGITELGIKVSLDKTTLAYIASIALQNNTENVLHDSEDVYHTGLTNSDVSQVLNTALQAYHGLIAYKKSKELEIESALDEAELEAITIGTDF